MRIDIIAAGRMKPGPALDLWAIYKKRLQWPVTLYEIEAKSQAAEQDKFSEKIDPRAFVFVLDERGKSLTSPEFSQKIQKSMAEGAARFQFIIGGADGHSDEVRRRADCLLSFGRQTWPHMLARIMLIEQIYRAQQIAKGHPYHRE